MIFGFADQKKKCKMQKQQSHNVEQCQNSIVPLYHCSIALLKNSEVCRDNPDSSEHSQPFSAIEGKKLTLKYLDDI